MNSTTKSIMSIIVAGTIFTLLLVNIQSQQPEQPIRDIQLARNNAQQIANTLNQNLISITSSLESLSYNSFWQSSPVAEWSYWLQSQKPLYQAAGLSMLGVHSVSNDVMYFDKPSLPGQYYDLKKPLSRMYQTESSVNLLQIFHNEPAIVILTPIKNIDNQLIGAIVGIQSLDINRLKSFHNLVKVPVVVINNNTIQTTSVETSPSLDDYQLIEVAWPSTINSALWKLGLLVEPAASISMSIIYSLIGAALTIALIIVIVRLLNKSKQTIRLLKDTLDIELPISEQINRLNTLQNLSTDDDFSQSVQSIRQRFEQLLQQKKTLSIEIRKFQENEKQLKKTVTKLKSERDSAYAAPKLKSEFLSRMGDEITTPMKSVVSMLKLLSEYQFDPEPKQLLNIAKRSTRTLVDNLNNILDFSKLDAGMLKLKPSRFSVREVIDELASELSHFANDKGLSLQASSDPEIPAEVTADLLRTKQILRNLLGNAIRFTKQGEVSVYADIVNKDERKMLRFTIKDSGVGIPVEAQKDLFDSLEQSTKLRNSSFAGRLRLIVSRHLALLMGGEIDVISDPGKGSQFWFTITID